MNKKTLGVVGISNVNQDDKIKPDHIQKINDKINKSLNIYK
jgi:hypothetical protein